MFNTFEAYLTRLEETQKLMLDEMRELRKLVEALSPAMSSLPPAPNIPRTPDMFLYEDWHDAALYYSKDEAPNIRWVRANSVLGTQDLANSEIVRSDIVPVGGGEKALKLHVAPSTYPQSIGCRVVHTNAKRWDALAPYAGKTIHIREYILFEKLPVLDDGDGSGGRWCSIGQVKDDPNIGALFQINLDEQWGIWMGTRPNSGLTLPAKQTRVVLRENTWNQLDLVWKMDKIDGFFDLSVNNVSVGRAIGKAAYINNFAVFQFCLYTDMLRAAADMYVGPTAMSLL